MENAEEGELFDMVANSGKFSEPTARYFFKQMLEFLSFIHSRAGVCHRDLKPENILLDKNFNIKVADFGFASPTIRDGKDKLKSYKGTLGYMTPEQLAGIKYCGRQADLFAAGVVLFTILTQCAPFGQASTKDSFYRYIAGNRPDKFWAFFKGVTTLSEDLKDLITGMFQLNPQARYTLEEIKGHPWVQGPTPTTE
jgi:serine/threonine protein kinase